MRAIVVYRLGDPSVLTLRSHPTPQPGPGEVLVRLQAIGVNFADTERRRGAYDPPALPWIPGIEGAGVVEALGPDVAPVWLGRRVAFWAPNTSGTYAEYAVTPANSLFSLLDHLDFNVAAALPVQGLTAYGLAHYATSLHQGQTALVHAAAGGVGTLLVQLLRHRGVRVFGTASTTAKQNLVRELGAIPLPYGDDLPERIRAATGDRGVDAVFDSVGRATQAQSLAVLALYGHLVYFGNAGGSPAPIHADELYPRNLRISSFWLAADRPERWDIARRELQESVATGQLRVTVGLSLPLADAAEAHRRLEQRRTQGKLILLPAA
ncbi:MAG TPA: quinone oxidoreductase [Gemmatimonadales bacterium]|nr:quinone oxidoreductase [Gemmatimonadales bacterium]